MIRYLFVYGTLQPKLAPPCVAHAVRQLRKVGRATAPGTNVRTSYVFVTG